MAKPAGSSKRTDPDTGAKTTHALPGRNGPSDDEIRAYVSDIRKIDAEIEVLSAKRKARRKLANGIGIVLGVMDRRIKRSGWAPDEIKEDWDVERRYAEILGQPIGTQLELYGDERTPDALKEQVRWRAVGRMHGMSARGAPEEPPEGCAPECRQPYAEGWMEGQKETQEAYLRANGGKAPSKTLN